jgi:hypothetical protein
MANGFDVVSVGIENEGAVVVLMVVGPWAGPAVVAAARAHRGAVKGVDFGARLRGKRDMRTALPPVSRADPEERLIVLAEAGVGVAASLFGGDFHDDGDAERLERVDVEGFRLLHIGHRKSDMINHDWTPSMAPNGSTGRPRRGGSGSCYNASARTGRGAGKRAVAGRARR